ncbi:MAG TPA: hypothetical protein PK725_00795 [Rhodocyclaceae bacterium]|nr:hypothetical protein [Rhodocyclaceae bacterium]HRQ45450.1 hypothetical protein [Rhodocyclaceae bacterium]
MRVWWIVLTVAAVVFCPAAYGEMEGDEYLPPAPPLSQEEVLERREKVLEEARQARIAADAQQEAEQLRREQELAARPPAQRLLELRCTGCHEIELVTLKPRTTFGWAWVTLRMQWINGAVLEPGERTRIATYLADHHRAPPRRALIELAVAAMIVALLAGLSWRAIRARRARKR